MIDLVSKRFLFILVSVLIIIPGIIAIALGGLRPGLDFTGGTRWTVKPLNQEAFDTEKFKSALAGIGYEQALVKSGTLGSGATGENQEDNNTITMDLPGQIQGEERIKVEKALIDARLVPFITETVTLGGTAPITGTATVTGTATITGTASPGSTITAASGTTITATTTVTGTAGASTGTTQPPPSQTVTRQRIPESAIVDFLAIGPTVGRELLNRAFLAIGLASAAILIYLTIVFRKVPNAFRYGVCAIVALLHDVLLVVGIFAMLGFALGVEIDALFITAMLTVIGFSVHDTIVVFDRVRENMLKRRFERFEDAVNYSLVQTLARSINTSITIILTLFALYLFGGASIRNFVLALLIGIISGTYSSIFNASMLLVIWEKREWFGPRKESSPAAR
jgi:preprotein translocase SecF subunit